MFEDYSKERILRHFEVDPTIGLTDEEVQKRRSQYGENRLEEKKKDSLIKTFFFNFKDPMTFILLGASVLSLILAVLNIAQGKVEPGREWLEFMDVAIIFAVVLINAVIGTVQEKKAEKALEALKKMSSPRASVRRGGRILSVDAKDLVPGDIVILEEGRVVPADIRILESFSLKSNESSLTGESLPCLKDASFVAKEAMGVGDRKNEVFMSTPIVFGKGEGVVFATGMNAEIGRIAGMLDGKEEEKTPLQKKLGQLSKFLGFLTVGIVVLMLLVKLLYLFVQGGLASGWPQALLDSVALAVAAIPEGLTATVTIVLAMGVVKMAKVNSIVKTLSSVETLGCVSVVCTDKTGTLTQNKMTVVASFTMNGTFEEGEPLREDALVLAQGMALCNDAEIENGSYGDPTEIALLEFAKKEGCPKRSLQEKYPLVDEHPFDSVRKMMSTQHKKEERGYVTYTKGAFDQILSKSDKALFNGEEVTLTKELVSSIEASSERMASAGLRVLALAKKESEEKRPIQEEGLCFVGLVGMIDPLRPECKKAMESLHGAGVQTVMITGDHKQTAFAIAKELGLASSLGQVMTGEEIDRCSENELKEKARAARVFARVSPQNKVEIVKALKANGNIVAMTGDGVNDAPSLKEADVGIAMGITGTDVAKGAADIVLSDDNFASIERAVEEGRGIYVNIKKTILFLLSSNIGEIVGMFIGTVLGLPSPLIGIHILWVNLITDSLPAIALGTDKQEENLMELPPREPGESLFAHGGLLRIFGYGLLIGALVFLAFLINPFQAGVYDLPGLVDYFSNKSLLEEAQSMAFCALSFSELFHMLGMAAGKRSVFSLWKDKNPMLWIAFLLGAALQFFVIEVPGVNQLFKVYPLSHHGVDYAWVFALALLPLLVHEFFVLLCFLTRKIRKGR